MSIVRALLGFFGMSVARELFADGSTLQPSSRQSLQLKRSDGSVTHIQIDSSDLGKAYRAYLPELSPDARRDVIEKVEFYYAKRGRLLLDS